jgi:hypothetical protein
MPFVTMEISESESAAVFAGLFEIPHCGNPRGLRGFPVVVG